MADRLTLEAHRDHPRVLDQARAALEAAGFRLRDLGIDREGHLVVVVAPPGAHRPTVEQERAGALERVRAIAPTLEWERSGTAFWASLPVLGDPGSFGLYVVEGSSCALLAGGLKWRISYQEPKEAAAELHARCGSYLRHWVLPDDLTRQGFMLARRAAVRAAFDATAWVRRSGAEATP